MTTTQSIPLNQLVQSKANVRRTGATTGIEALMASIASHGLRQNLNVRPTTGGRFEVVAGGRRLIAMKKLARAGTIPAGTEVPCLVLAEADNATEISLAENQLRQEMHPDDQCNAFQRLNETGMPVEDVAARFGVTPTVVRQRLKLAAVSPKLRALYRAGEATLEQMMALTLTDDHAAQEQAFAAGGSSYGIRRMLTHDTVALNARLVTFVGLEAYRQAGGGIVDDLFNPEDGYLTDPALLNSLAAAKLAEAAKAIESEGWSWVKPELTRDIQTAYSRVYGERDDAGSIVYNSEQLAGAGARVTIDYGGELEIERGLVRPEDARSQARAERDATGESRGRPDYPAAVVTDLTGHQTAALRLKLAQTPKIALAATVHALIGACRNPYSPQSAMQVSVKVRELAGVVAAPEECSAHAGMAAELNRWNDRIPAHPAQLWDWLAAQNTDTLMDVLATFAALTLDVVRSKASEASIVHGHQLADALDLDMADHWQPSPAFVGRLSKPVMAIALTEAGQAAVAADIPQMKKASAAAMAAQVLAGTGWLPPVLRRSAVVIVNDNVQVSVGEAVTAEVGDEEAA